MIGTGGVQSSFNTGTRLNVAHDNGSILQEIAQLVDQVSCLEGLVCTLQDRLEAVLMPLPPVGKEGPMGALGPSPAKPHLAEKIFSERARLQGISDHITSILQRVDI